MTERHTATTENCLTSSSSPTTSPMLSSPTAHRASTDLSFFSASKSSKPVSSSKVVVTTRVSRKPAQPARRIPPQPKSPTPVQSTSSSPLSSPPSSPPRKRKSPPTSTPSESSAALPREVKRLRTTSAKQKPRKRASAASSKASSRASSHQRTLAPEPESIYRIDRSRSASLFPLPDPDAPIQTRKWITDEDGKPGPHHFSSEMVVTKLIKSYKAYFRNHQDPFDESFDPKNRPVVELEYPNNGASERFLLLAPKDKDHYNPIMDLEKTLYTLVECYLTPEQQAQFGPMPNETLCEAPSPPSSRSPSPTPAEIPFETPTSSSSNSPPLPPSSPPSPFPVLRAIQRAIHTQNGPLFLKVMQKVNLILQGFKYPKLPEDPYKTAPNPFMEMVSTWTEKGMPQKVLMRIIEENYQRSVGPHVQSLKQYEAFSSTVYGELMPSLAHEIIQITGLKEDSLFLDLGSGVGNVVVQASLQTGCTSYGIEILKAPARVASDMREHLKVRCRMWGVTIGEVELEEGDMLNSKRVDELISKADVVLVDNKVFEESLNEALKPKFLDLKDGAIVVSLSPFVSSLNARVTERNVDDISAIFEVTERSYYSGMVSWGNNGGFYYVHRVDREGYSKIRERFENSRASTSRSTRTRRS